MELPVPFGPATLHSRYEVRVVPLETSEALGQVAAQTVFGWDDEDPEQRRLSRMYYEGEYAQQAAAYRVTWVEGTVRPLKREMLWRVARVEDKLVWTSLDRAGFQRRPHWLANALSKLLVDLNSGLRERDLACLPPAPDRRAAWRFMHDVGAVRNLRLDDFYSDDVPQPEDVVHLRDLPELLWLAATADEDGRVYEWTEEYLKLARGLFEVLGMTDHWLYRNLSGTPRERSKIVVAATQAPTDRATETPVRLWMWRDRLMASAEPWSGILYCRHPVKRGTDGRWWEGWGAASGPRGRWRTCSRTWATRSRSRCSTTSTWRGGSGRRWWGCGTWGRSWTNP